jgi:threonine/homoserine/homoserine lactone efflux protein
VAFLLFAVVAAVTPGPSNIMLTAAGAQAGIAGGLRCLLGVVSGMGVMIFVVPLGLGRLVLAHPLILQTLHWGGAGFLLWLSWKIATAKSRIDAESAPDPVGYLGAATFQWVNAKSWLVAVSAAGTFLGTEHTSAMVQAASLAGLFILAALPSGFLWLAFGAAIQRVLRTQRRLRLFNLTMGALLALSIVLILR